MRDTAVIVWPVLGTEIPEAHVTVAFLGPILKQPNSYVNVMAALLDGFNLTAPGRVDVIGHEVFGRDFKVEASILDPTLLEFRQKMLMRSLNKMGVQNASEFKSYRPHLSIRPWKEGQEMDSREFFVLDTPQLWWGDAKLSIDSEE